jgi:ribosome-binding protein aMBF1 (putative translation factor)
LIYSRPVGYFNEVALARHTEQPRRGSTHVDSKHLRHTVEPAVTSMNRNDVTELIISARRNKQLSWSSIAADLNAPTVR